MLIKNCTVAFKFVITFSPNQFLCIAQRGINTEYRPRRFHAIVMRLRQQQQQQTTVAALIFRSGRVVLTGVPEPRLARAYARRVRRRIQHSLGLPLLNIERVRIVNVVGAHTMPHRMAVERMSADSRLTQPVYDPTIFPALRFKFCSATCLVYISGKVIVTGVPTSTLLHTAFTQLLPILQAYKRQ